MKCCPAVGHLSCDNARKHRKDDHEPGRLIHAISGSPSVRRHLVSCVSKRSPCCLLPAVVESFLCDTCETCTAENGSLCDGTQTPRSEISLFKSNGFRNVTSHPVCQISGGSITQHDSRLDSPPFSAICLRCGVLASC